MNDLYLKKKERDDMGDLSLYVFGSRGKWLKLARQLGLSLESAKLQMKAIEAQMKKELSHVSNETRPEQTEPNSNTDVSVDSGSEST